MYAAVLIALWGLLTLFAFGCVMAAGRPMPAMGGDDPYAAEVAAFRRELHDWDR